MRIVELELAGFRGFASDIKLNIDADAVLVVAPNGQGKTSLFDAILWALTGSVPRLKCDDSKLLSLYSTSGEMHVKVKLRDREGGLCLISRSSDGKNQRITFEYGQRQSTGAGANAKLIEALWPAALTNNEPNLNFAAVLARSVYLQQDSVRHFIESETDQERFNAISDLVGSGNITDLQVQLDNARSAWSRATNELVDREKFQRDRVLSLETQISKLAHPLDEGPLHSRWATWWADVARLAIDTRKAPSMEGSEAAPAIDSALKLLQAKRGANERSKALIEQLLLEIRSQAEVVPPNTKELGARLAEDQEALDSAKGLLEKTEETARAEIRDRLKQARSQDEIKALAELALRHLGDRCPVCEQTYDRDKTTDRLRKLAQATPGPTVLPSREHIDELARTVERHERALSEIRRQLDSANRMAGANAAWSSERARRLTQVGIDPDSTEPAEALANLLKETNALSSQLTALQEEGEKLALQLARAAEAGRRLEVERELVDAKDQLSKSQAELFLRQRTWELATSVLDALREASTDFVDSELKRIEPLLQRIYARIDPHPSFRVVRFLTSFAYRRGRLLMSMFDPSAQLSSDAPEVILSSSQLNALAVSVFLSLNLGVSTLPLQAAILDDPLQSLDDINLLGVVDLLRRTRDARQLLVSTHDYRFGDLLAKKLRPVSDIQRTRVIEFEGWTRQGPTIVDQREIGQDLKPLKIAV